METIGHIKLGDSQYPLLKHAGCPCCNRSPVYMEHDYDENENILIRVVCDYCGEYYIKI